ncbi:Tabersonine 6,7-epoxidase isoform 2 [Clonorchis sinensis]|uniref:Tabersonine 6,7-epoxidase isoform 2 n=1 Tax=Clonorchis sinensis TaxID=79923 RepID=A0A8T1M3K7_CLOSI|nr:Tabersonine 6,7-epoxidase isoform 2 [Clonorchis sinensis]
MSTRRTPSSGKNKWQPPGSISFSAAQDEDISGLDEAVQSFSRANQAVVPNSSSATGPARISDPVNLGPLDSGLQQPALDNNPPVSFELAVDATSIVDEELESVAAQTSVSKLLMDALNDGPADVTVAATRLQPDAVATDPIVITGRSLDSEAHVLVNHVLPRSSAPDICMVPTASNLDDPFTSPSAPIRPPPFQPRAPPEPVAAEDIHALLDSFTPPKGNGILDSEPRKRTVPPIPPCFIAPTDASGLEEDLLSISDQPLSFGGDTQPNDGASMFPDQPHAPESGRSASRSRSESLGSLGKITTHLPPTAATVVHSSLSEDVPRATRRVKPRRSSKSDTTILTGTGLFFAAGLALILASFYFFSAFAWGLAFGVICTLLVTWLYRLIWPSPADSDVPLCHISGLPLGELCCSLHCQSVAPGCAPSRTTWWPIFAPAIPPLRKSPPRLRDLQPLTIPYMKDEDVSSSALSGPLGTGLGFRFDKADRPIYKGWMNEVTEYDPETHHVSRTHSVFVTLDGTQLRLQRPRRNISRRSMWNEELPSGLSTRFQNQRIFDLVQARVTLLPSGLVSKRLWSKKYPIAITLPLQPNRKTSETMGSKQSLPSSVSVPNMRMQSVVSASQSPVKYHSQAATAETIRRKDNSQSHTSTDLVGDDFYVVSHGDASVETLYLFGRTCREKEAWYGRLRAASLGVPLFWTPQLAVQTFLSSSANMQEQRSDEEVRSEVEASMTDSSVELTTVPSDKAIPAVAPYMNIPGSRDPLYVSYVRYMAKYMPADWLLRGSQALRLNVNYISCDPSLLWLNAFLARIFWDFLREVYWLERVRDKIQAKLKKIHLPPFISDLVVVGIDLGSELPVIRRIGRPHLDAHGLWFELEVAYAGGFSVALETNVNLLRWNQKNRIEREAANLADDTSGALSSSGSVTPDPNLFPPIRRSSRLGAFLSDEEDSADSTTDSDVPVEMQPTGQSSTRRPSVSRLTSQAGPVTAMGMASLDEERPSGSESSLQLPSALPSRRRFIRLVDRIARSSYFQKAVDNKLVQRGMELLSNTPIVLEAEIQALSGTLLVNIPPPPSDRLWYGFQPNPQLRLKARPRVGEKAVTMSRILEWIENRVALEFQRLLVLPNMDDVSIPLLLSDVTAGEAK